MTKECEVRSMSHRQGLYSYMVVIDHFVLKLQTLFSTTHDPKDHFLFKKNKIQLNFQLFISEIDKTTIKNNFYCPVEPKHLFPCHVEKHSRTMFVYFQIM